MSELSVNGVSKDKQRSSTVRILFAIHGWSGAVLGLLLYAVILTGAVAVFHEEIGKWTSPLPLQPEAVFMPGLDKAVKSIAPTIDSKYYDEVDMFPTTAERLGVFFHIHVHPEGGGQPYAEGVMIRFDPGTWEVVSRQEGKADDIKAADNKRALGRFLVRLHVRLYVPEPWGLILTGILGLAMMVAAITGLIVHRKLIKDLFMQRVSLRNPLLTTRDRHVAAGSWNLIFAFLLAFTGSFFSFAGSFGFPILAMVSTGGDQEKLAQIAIGLPQPYDDSAAGVVNLDTLIGDAKSRARDAHSHPESLAIRRLTIQRWGQADAIAVVANTPALGDLVSSTLVYHGATGEFIKEKPQLGTRPSLGNDLLGIIRPLHFGDFAGVISKAIWFGLGIAAAYVTFTGLLLWTQRRYEQREWRLLAKMTVWMGYGLPLSLALTPTGYFLAIMFELQALTVVKWTFVTGTVYASIISYFTSDLQILRKHMLYVVSISLFAAVALRWFSGGMDWFTALNAGWVEIPAFDTIFLIAALLILFRLYIKQPETTLFIKPVKA